MARVMIVDDDRTTISLLKTLLELDGYDVDVVSMGGDVIPKAQQQPPDLILMDYHLADISGMEVLNELRQHANLTPIPVIVASGMNVEAEVMAAGAAAFLVKPLDPDALSSEIKRLVAG